MSFYLTLPSNSEKNHRTGYFRVHLPETIKVNEPYEVAVVEIIYPNSWNNVSDGSNDIYARLDSGNIVNFKLPIGHYQSISDLLYSLNMVLDPYVKFSQSRSSAHVHYIRHENVSRIHISELLQYMLGFDSPDLEDKKGKAKFYQIYVEVLIVYIFTVIL